jgi:proteasome lid subunit RPN8/RPN11
MDIIEDQYKDIIKHFPNVKTYNNFIFHISIHLNKGTILEIDYRNFPKKPKVKLINQNGAVYKKLDRDIYSLNRWKSNNPKPISEIINEIILFIDNLESDTILIKAELLEGILLLCREQHPREILGILKMEKNVFTEFILPPGTLTSKTSGIFFSSRLPLDNFYQASVHSHPSGNVHPSLQDLGGVFKKFKCHFIIGFPYGPKNVRCYDKNGKPLKIKIVKYTNNKE